MPTPVKKKPLAVPKKVVEPVEDPKEVMAKFNGRALRTTEERTSKAECLDPDCPWAWTGTNSVAASGNHAVGHGHSVRQWYEAVYRLDPL